MIIDSINNLKNYSSVIPHLPAITSFLIEKNISALEEGKYPVEGENVFLIIQKYTTKPEGDKRWESHRKYIDIQYVISGSEYMGHSLITNLIPADEYNESKDILFYKEINSNFSRLFVYEGFFAVFFPEDGHKPGCHISESFNVKKAVIKVSAK
jgi:YhcH/YjgK/YiaL family protein